DQEGLAQAGHALQKHVPAGDQGAERALDDVVLADDHLADLGAEPAEVGAEPFELTLDRVGTHGRLPKKSAFVGVGCCVARQPQITCLKLTGRRRDVKRDLRKTSEKYRRFFLERVQPSEYVRES